MIIGAFAIAALCCLGYFFMIVCYSGIGTSASFLWLMAGSVFGGTAFVLRYYGKHPGKLPLWLPVSMITLIASGFIVLISVEGLIFLNVPRLALPGMDYLIVLGAKVSPDRMTKTLEMRLDKAAEYAAENPDTVLVLSGGQGMDEHASEARVMFEYLLEKGVPMQQMLLETDSTNTVENIVYSNYLIQKDREAKKSAADAPVILEYEEVLQAPDKPLEIGIVTNNFHLFRAGLIAKKRDMGHVSQIAAGSDPVLLIHLSVRECLAILKDRLLGNI